MIISYLLALLSAYQLTVGATLPNGNLSFIAIGDWGGVPYSPYTTQIQKAVAQQMGKVAAGLDAKFIVGLGDNFYYDGVKNVDDIRFKNTFEDVFTAPSLYKKWFMIAGNHDHHMNISAQIAYSKRSKRWFFPDLNYTVQYKDPKSNKSLQIVFFDTVVLCGNTDKSYVGQPPIGPEDPVKARTQLLWLDDQLRSSKADYLLVAGHYPVYSIAEHGPTKCLLQQVEPMLHKYRVTAYINGHDHNLQHLHYKDETYNVPVDYFVIGSGAFVDPSHKHKHSVPRGSLKYYWADATSLGGFGSFTVQKNGLLVTYYKANGAALYKITLPPRKY